MKEIPLTQGKVALVDDADFERLSQWKWSAQKTRSYWYAKRNTSRQTGKRIVYMHVEIMQPPTGVKIDHKDHDGLNNQRYNLRYSTHAENVHNRKNQRGNKSGYKGVHWNKRKGKWQATVTVNYHQIYLGLFTRAEDAARAYDRAARTHHGEFAYLNFPNES